MNKKRYWKKRYNFALSLYYNEGMNMKDDLLIRVYDVMTEIGDYLFNMEDD